MAAKKTIYLLDESISVEIFFESSDCDLQDNICIKLIESCPEDEKILKHDESHLYLTTQQAMDLADALLTAVHKSDKAHKKDQS